MLSFIIMKHHLFNWITIGEHIVSLKIARRTWSVERSAIGQTHPVEKVYPVGCNIAVDAAREGRLSVDNYALLLTSDDCYVLSRIPIVQGPWIIKSISLRMY